MKKAICIYMGLGAHKKDSVILLRALTDLVDNSLYHTKFVSPQQIIEGSWREVTSLLAIGGGYDRGLMKELGQSGMAQIREFVHTGGSYLGLCSGAYFACDSIIFDEGGPLEVIGERFLKFYPGQCVGPVYKDYDYNSRRGAVAAMINFEQNCDTVGKNTEIGSDTVNMRLNQSSGTHTVNQSGIRVLNQSHNLDKSHMKIFPVYFNGGGCFVPEGNAEACESQAFGHFHETGSLMTEAAVNAAFNDGISRTNKTNISDITCNTFDESLAPLGNKDTGDLGSKVDILSRYQQVAGKPIATVKCSVGSGTAVLSGVHFEYDARDIDDGDPLVTNIIPQLVASKDERDGMFKSILNSLGIHVSCKAIVTKSGNELKL